MVIKPGKLRKFISLVDLPDEDIGTREGLIIELVFLFW